MAIVAGCRIGDDGGPYWSRGTDPMAKVRLLITATVLFPGCVLAAVPASAQQNETLTEQAKIEQIVHDYLLAHPEVIIQAIQSYQAEQDKQAAAKQAQALVDRRE